MDSNILDLMRNTIKKGKMERGITEEAGQDLKDILSGVQSHELFQNVVQIEVDQLKKEARENKAEYEKKMKEKKSVINDLTTSLENAKTELNQMSDAANTIKNSIGLQLKA